MVGFKTLFLGFTLLLLGACVPQVKQSDCGAGEAFSSVLRTCVPLVNSPGSYINIQSPNPNAAITLHRNNGTPHYLSFAVNDPYSQGFTISWDRSFNGNTSSLPDTTNALTFVPASLASVYGTGTFLYTAKIWSGGVVVTSYTFQIILVDAPKPIIASGTLIPGAYHETINPFSPHKTYGFTIHNNNAVMTGGINYRVDWKVYKNGSAFLAADESQALPTVSPAGTLASNGSNYPRYIFDHNLPGAGVGNYLIIAHLTNTNSELVAQQQWTLTIEHPERKKVLAQRTYDPASGFPEPGAGATTVAYSGINYNLAPAYNFIPVGAYTEQADYCVVLEDDEGTYPGQYIKVSYYLDGHHFHDRTTATSETVCLSDANPTILSGLLFNTSSPLVEQTKNITVRITDLATNQEYTTADLQSPLNEYPLKWPVLVKPVNPAPIVRFTENTNLSGINCPDTSTLVTTTSKTCAIAQDAPFVVGINATDEFFNTSSTDDLQQGQFSYNMRLFRNGAVISTCTKDYTDVADTNAPPADFVGPDYLCEFTVPSWDAAGSINPALNTYSVQIEFKDNASPIPGSIPATGQIITYNLNVTEANTAPVIVPQGITIADSYLAVSTNNGTPLSLASDDSGAANTFITEGEILNFNLKVQDNERDDFQVVIRKCTTSACTAFEGPVLSQMHYKTDHNLESSVLVNLPLLEDFVPGNTAANTNVDVFFKIFVTDDPDTVAGIQTETVTPNHFNVNVRNRNPSPQFGGTPIPALAVTNSIAMVGYPFQINPGTITDTSSVGVEAVIRYQWYIDPTGSDDSYVAIAGADGSTLYWTPSNDIVDGTLVNIAVCVSNDQPINSQPLPANIGTLITSTNSTPNGPNCLGSWDVTVRNNTVALSRDGGIGGDIGENLAVWQDSTVTDKRTVYTAYHNSNYIFVEKTLFNADGEKFSTETSGYRTVSFLATSPATSPEPNSIKDLSIAGTATHLYVAYRAADSGDPSSYKVRIRRIDKRDGTVSGLANSKTDPTYHDTRTFGFRYLPSVPTTTAGASVTISTAATYPYTIDFIGDLVATNTITVHGVAFTATDGGTPLCSGGGAFGCTHNANATQLATAINSSTDRALQGVSARAIGPRVYIYGDVGHEFSEENPAFMPGGIPSAKLGKIYISGGSWYLPYLDTAAFPNASIRSLAGSAGEADRLATLAIANSVYSLAGVSNFVNDFNGTHVGVLYTDSSNKLNIANFNPGSYSPLATKLDLFNGLGIGPGIEPSSIDLALPNSGNTNYYVTAKSLITGEWFFGRYDTSFTTSTENVVDYIATAGTTPVLYSPFIQRIKVEAMASATATGLVEARLAVKSANNLYAVRYRPDGFLSCDLCNPINNSALGSESFALSRIDTQMSIGAIGGTPASTPITKDVFFVAFGIDTNSDMVFEPQMSIINANAESIQATSTGTGFRPPYIGGN